MGTDPTITSKVNIIKPIPQKACELFGPTCPFCRQQAPHPSPNQSDWSSLDWNGEKAKAREQNSFIRFDTTRPITDNATHDSVDSIPFHGLTIQTDRLDEKAPENPTTLDPLLEQGTGGTSSKESQPMLDPVVEEEEKQAEQEIREHIEEAKYKLYIGQLSTEESDLDTDMDKSDYPFLD